MVTFRFGTFMMLYHTTKSLVGHYHKLRDCAILTYRVYRWQSVNNYCYLIPCSERQKYVLKVGSFNEVLHQMAIGISRYFVTQYWVSEYCIESCIHTVTNNAMP